MTALECDARSDSPGIEPLCSARQTVSETTDVQLNATAEWLDQARRFLAEARATLSALQLQADRVLASQQQVEIQIDEMTTALTSVRVLVRKAEKHADGLMTQVRAGVTVAPPPARNASHCNCSGLIVYFSDLL